MGSFGTFNATYTPCCLGLQYKFPKKPYIKKPEVGRHIMIDLFYKVQKFSLLPFTLEFWSTFYLVKKWTRQGERFYARHLYHNHNNDECYNNSNLNNVTRIVQRTCPGAPELVSNFGKRYPGKKLSLYFAKGKKFQVFLISSWELVCLQNKDWVIYRFTQF